MMRCTGQPKTSVSTSNFDPPPNRPDRMYRHDRPVDPEFLPSELLYYRIAVTGPVGSCPDGVDIRLPEDSVNRGKYSEPTDVLFPDYFHLGVAEFPVSKIPAPRSFTDQQGNSRGYELKVEHDPKEDNYAHSELRAFRERSRVTHTGKIPVTVKSEFRQLVAEAMVIRVAVPAGHPTQ